MHGTLDFVVSIDGSLLGGGICALRTVQKPQVSQTLSLQGPRSQNFRDV
jgi:hypothetical protein